MLVVLGLNHNSAPVTVRERMAIKKDEMAGLYKKFLAENSIHYVWRNIEHPHGKAKQNKTKQYKTKPGVLGRL